VRSSDPFFARSPGLVLLALAWLAASLCGCGGGYRPKPHEPYEPTDEEAEWDRHHQAEKDGRFDEALAGYDAMCRRDEPYPRACYDLSRLLFELERFAEARAAALAFVGRFPDNALVQPAAKRLGRHYAEAARIDEGVTELGRLASKVAGSDAEDTVIYQIARLHREAGRLDAEARELERIVAMGRWNSQLWNDSIWRLAEVRGEQGDPAAEERLLEQLLDSRESSVLIGSYTTGLHDDAMLRLGRLRLERGRADEAYDTFVELSKWKTSRERDDALLWAARARIAQGRDADACELLERLLDEMPDASAVREARQLHSASGCEPRQ
jgi:TolA-binding protein